jgi:hypothetical protein
MGHNGFGNGMGGTPSIVIQQNNIAVDMNGFQNNANQGRMTTLKPSNINYVP